MVLQGAGDDLGGGRGAAVHEHHERGAVDQVARRRVHPEARIRGAAVGGDDDARVQEVVRDRDAGLEHAARIVSQVEHKTPDSAWIVSLESQYGALHVLGAWSR